MAEFNQFGSAAPLQTSEAQHCAQCEAMLADAFDGTLSAADQAVFDLHMLACTSCSTMLAKATRGAAWLEMLKSPRPEPPAALLERIFAQTCNQTSSQTSPASGKQKEGLEARQPNTILGRPSRLPGSAAPSMAAYGSATVLPFRSRLASSFRLRSIGQTLLQPRLAMTAAMAFFSIALTLNLTGVRLNNLRAGDLRPSSLKRNFYEANAHVVRYYDNLKVVYELESRVRDLQRSNGSDDPYRSPSKQNAPTPQPDRQPVKPDPATRKPDSKQSPRKPGPGTSLREIPSPNVQLADAMRRRGPLPATQSFVVFTPSVLKYLQEEEMV